MSHIRSYLYKLDSIIIFLEHSMFIHSTKIPRDCETGTVLSFFADSKKSHLAVKALGVKIK